MGHLSIAPIKDCVNVDSFGLICIHCNQCGRFNKNKIKKEEINELTEIQVKLLDVLKNNGALKREEICEHLGFESYLLEYNHHYPTWNLQKTKQQRKMQLHSKRTTIYNNLVKLEKKGLVSKYSKNNGKRGRPPTYWKIQGGIS